MALNAWHIPRMAGVPPGTVSTSASQRPAATCRPVSNQNQPSRAARWTAESPSPAATVRCPTASRGVHPLQRPQLPAPAQLRVQLVDQTQAPGRLRGLRLEPLPGGGELLGSV